jgi:HD superfamily phosphohydrolase
MHLMSLALDTLRSKGIEISNKEYEACQLAILLHDIGHGPFSHALEYSLLPGISHESLSFLFMKQLNADFDHSLETAMSIFQNTYPRKFFHQLVSSQLDMDRLDYLKRDSFFTGVSEGSVGVERIIQMLAVKDDQMVVEEKALYSLENFLNARRLMYWQVYLHKASVSAEKMLINLINRAKEFVEFGQDLEATDALKTFLKKSYTLDDFHANPQLLKTYGQLDDSDIWASIKHWQFNMDSILSMLSNMLLERRLFKISLSNEPIARADIMRLRDQLCSQYNLFRSSARYLMSHGEVTNKAYFAEGQKINILTKRGNIVDIAEAADLPNIKAMSKIVKKYYLCCPKTVSL